VRGALAGLVIAAFAATPAGAQTPPAKPAPHATPAPTPSPTPSPSPTPTEPPPPYDAQLLRLAELMGALSYLRDLCAAGDGPAFRDKMALLLEAEARTTERKEILAGAFNRGFGDYQLTYRVCTPAAEDIVARFLDESARIARDVANRYGG
jgi:uncharacterized protein (TIGR02301 family)